MSVCRRDQCGHPADRHHRTRQTRVASSGRLARCLVVGCGCRQFATRPAKAQCFRCFRSIRVSVEPSGLEWVDANGGEYCLQASRRRHAPGVLPPGRPPEADEDAWLLAVEWATAEIRHDGGVS